MHDKSMRWKRAISFIVCACLFLWNGLTLADDYDAQEYRLQPGDVLGFSVIGYPELQRRAVVEQSGTVVLPMVGALNVGGKTLVDVRDRVIEGLRPKSLPNRLSDGTETWTAFYPDLVVVNIEEYRPVYVDGDVVTPGSLPFRPGMTVRQVVASVGGYQVRTTELEKAADLTGRLNVLRARRQESEIRVASIRAQLDGNQEFTAPARTDAALADRRKEALQQEQNRLDAVSSDQEKERRSIELGITQAAKRMEYLLEQQTTEQLLADADEKELARLKGLFDKGLMEVTRVNEAQRAVLLSATRALQTSAALAQLEREQGTLQRSLEKLDDGARIALLAELQTETAAMTQMQAEMDALTKQLSYVGLLRSDLMNLGERQLSVSVARLNEGKTTTFAASEDTLLSPGDTVTVKLQALSGTAAAN